MAVTPRPPNPKTRWFKASLSYISLHKQLQIQRLPVVRMEPSLWGISSVTDCDTDRILDGCMSLYVKTLHTDSNQ